MKKLLSKNRHFVYLNTGFAAFAFLFLSLWTGCAPRGTISVVEKNVEEKRLVSEAAVDEYNILDEYDHLLPLPENKLLSISLFSDQTYFLNEGGNTVAQIGISTREPEISSSQIHLLIDSPLRPNEGTLNDISNIVSAVQTYEKNLPQGSGMTIDWMRKPLKSFSHINSLLPYEEHKNLEQFLRPYLLYPYQGKKHLIILVVGEHGKLSRAQQQNLVDMAGFLSTKEVTLSVLAFGKKPDVAFLDKLSQRGNGLFHILTDDLNLAEWIQADVENMHAPFLKDIRIQVELGHNIELMSYLHGASFVRDTQQSTFKLPKLKLGEQRVLLAKLNIPRRNTKEVIEVIRARITYYDPLDNKYHNTNENRLFGYYTDDMNKALTQHNPLVQRSLLLIKTAETLQKVADELRQRRTYNGMALLSAQSKRLRDMGHKHQDDALLRDAVVLDNYAKRLYDFSDEYFQGFKTWRDLTWDKNRFEDNLK